MPQHWLRHWLWIDAQLALWSVLLLLIALAATPLLKRRLPLWRKGLWLSAMLLPLALVLLALLSSSRSHALVPTQWFRFHSKPASYPNPAASAPTLAAWIYLAWIAVNLLIELAGTLRLHRLLSRSVPPNHPATVAIYTHLVRSMNCARPPRLVQSDEVASPFIVAGPFRGLTIVLPDALALLEHGPVPLRAVLAHELAHARAGDPWLQRLLPLLRAVLPLTWLCALAATRLLWEDAAEQTGDLRAIAGSQLSAPDYAAALKNMAVLGEAPPLAPALAFSPHDAQLSPQARSLARRLLQRLRALPLASQWSEPLASNLAAAARAIVLGAFLLLLLAGQSPLHALLLDPRGAPQALPQTPVKHPAKSPRDPASSRRPAVKELPAAQSALDLKRKAPDPRRNEKHSRKDRNSK